MCQLPVAGPVDATAFALGSGAVAGFSAILGAGFGVFAAATLGAFEALPGFVGAGLSADAWPLAPGWNSFLPASESCCLAIASAFLRSGSDISLSSWLTMSLAADSPCALARLT